MQEVKDTTQDVIKQNNESPKMAEVTKDNLPNHVITKKAAALEVFNQARHNFIVCMVGYGAVFMVLIGSIFGLTAGSIIGFVFVGAFGFYGFKAKKKMDYLRTTYEL